MMHRFAASNRANALLAALLVALCLASGPAGDDRYPWPEALSDWHFFTGDLASMQPHDRTVPYDVRSPLYSDYAFKKRFVVIPPGETMTYRPDGVFDMPEGSVLVKSFYYPRDFRKPDHDHQIIETRLMIRANGNWHTAAYTWNDDQSDAILALAGDNRLVQWQDKSGKQRELNYLVPNANQCTNCHVHNGAIQPIGITARQLNHHSLLQEFEILGLIDVLPPASDIPVMPDYRDPSGADLDSRARAYLDANCAHCHAPAGPANSSGLYLQFAHDDAHALGVMKAPVAAGRGSGGRKFNIVPGKPNASILLHRMKSNDPGVRMPEINRQVPHQEGIALIRDWIKSIN